MTASADLRNYLISRCSLFRGLPAEARVEAGRRAVCRRVARDAELFRERDSATGFYLLYSGRLKLFHVDEKGHERLERLIGPGQFCGRLGVSAGERYPATARAIEASAALAWEKKDLDELLARYPDMIRNAERIQARRERERDERGRELATLRVAERLALTLLRLVCAQGRRFEDGLLDDVPLSRADLAQLTGSTPLTVSRLLTDWEAEGIVCAGRTSLRVEDARRLQGVISRGLQGLERRRN